MAIKCRHVPLLFQTSKLYRYGFVCHLIGLDDVRINIVMLSIGFTASNEIEDDRFSLFFLLSAFSKNKLNQSKWVSWFCVFFFFWLENFHLHKTEGIKLVKICITKKKPSSNKTGVTSDRLKLSFIGNPYRTFCLTI